MLDFENQDTAREEVSYARDERDRVLAIYDRQVDSYTSAFWKNAEGYNANNERGDDPENVYFEFQALMLPRLANGVPECIVETSRQGPQAKEMAIAAKHAWNRWAHDTKHNEVMALSCVDFGFNFSVLHVSITENEFLGGDGKLVNREWPEVNRISQRDYFCDPLAKSYDLVRFEGHDELMDKDDLLERAKRDNDDGGEWLLDEIEGLTAGDGDETGSDGAPLRNQVKLTSVWVRGYEGEDHPGAEARCYGTVFTYGGAPHKEAQDMVLIHKPEPFFGPPTGPYECASAYIVPDSPYGVSSLTANEGPIRDLNRHARANSDDAATEKTLVLVNNTDPHVSDKIANAEHQTVLEVAGLTRDDVIPAQVGGISETRMGYMGVSRDRVDRLMGLSNAMRGVATGGKTATAEALATQGGDIRVDGYRNPFIKLHNRVAAKVLWYMLSSERFQELLSPAAVEELGGAEGEEVLFQGGFEAGQEDEIRPEDLELRIEVTSVAHESPAAKQQKAQVGHEILMGVLGAAVQAPWVTWKDHLSVMGDAFGIPNLPDMWDQELYEQFVARAMQLEAAGAQVNQGARLESHPGDEPVPLPFQQVKQSAFGSLTMPGQSMGSEAGAQAQQTPSGLGGFA